MKKLYIFFSSIVLSFALIGHLSALSTLSIGRDGPSYIENGIVWQPVSCIFDDVGFKASLPGEPSSGMSGEDAFSYSEHQDVKYEIHSNLNERSAPPKKASDFIKKVKNAFKGEASVSKIDTNQSKVKYIAELSFKKGNKIARAYCSKNCLYWAIVEGEDLSLAPAFFDSIKITR